MRVSVVAVVLCCLGVVGYVSARHRTDTCWGDAECARGDQYCFCFKTQGAAAQGHCVCKIDPSHWRPQPVPSCFEDLDCEHLAYGAQTCFCDRQQQRVGQCKCVNGLLR
ncbi:uncharacterized protein LOC113505165 [Trichoplusia ni]|uniref:Uncharacterized protein LOC113505165 n=1 Tax=Trichoplusia ni TaxID=7111 RepID=A0A7E5WTC4_TRINI|nr:uncharacterized protein LOC113505165 [Trichoplusia ni]